MANEERFTGLSELYARYRPSYPPGCVAWVMAECGLGRGDAVADIGAGTGIFSALLLDAGLCVTAVEPNADMGEKALAALGGRPGFTLVAAGAEHTGLAAHSVRLVTAAQAFHWFEPAAFAAECRRILAPGGEVAVVWNTRDAAVPLAAEYEALRKAHCTDYKGWAGVPGSPPEGLRRFFARGWQVRLFPNPRLYSEDSFIGHAHSASYAPRQAAAQAAYTEALRAFFNKHAVGGTLSMPFVTEVYLGAP